MARLTARIRQRSELSLDDNHAMFDLYSSYYDAVSFEMFVEDLASKSHVIEMYAEDHLRGFSTVALIPFSFNGSPQLVIFSGDTIIHHEYWGEQSLVLTFCRFAGQLKAELRDTPLFWFLISKGYRTYRYLGLFAKAYFPHHRIATPAPMQQRMHYLAGTKFGPAYDPETGVIRFPQSRGHLKPRYATVKPALLSHPAVQFFLHRNPGFHKGEEVVCLVELSEDNLRSFAKRSFMEGLNAAVGQVAAQ